MEMSENGKLNVVMLKKPPVIHNFPIGGTLGKNDDIYDEPYDIDNLIAQGRYII